MALKDVDLIRVLVLLLVVVVWSVIILLGLEVALLRGSRWRGEATLVVRSLGLLNRFFVEVRLLLSWLSSVGSLLLWSVCRLLVGSESRLFWSSNC